MQKKSRRLRPQRWNSPAGCDRCRLDGKGARTGLTALQYQFLGGEGPVWISAAGQKARQVEAHVLPKDAKLKAKSNPHCHVSERTPADKTGRESAPELEQTETRSNVYTETACKEIHYAWRHNTLPSYRTLSLERSSRLRIICIRVYFLLLSVFKSTMLI